MRQGLHAVQNTTPVFTALMLSLQKALRMIVANTAMFKAFYFMQHITNSPATSLTTKQASNPATNMQYPLALMLTILLTITACSKKEEYAESSAASADMQGIAAVPAAEPAEKLQNPQDVPAVLLSETANPVEKSRPMVKTASISFEVKDVYQSALQLEQLTTEYGGVVEQKNINKQLEDQYQRNNNDGTLSIYQKFRPQASMVVRIPSDQTQRFINTLPKYMQFLNEQRYEAKRFQLKLLEEKLKQQASNHGGDTKTASRLAAEIAELTRQEVQDRLNYSTIQLDFSQPATLHKKLDIQLNQVAKQDEPFLSRMGQAIQAGATGFVDVVVFMTLLWPLWLITVIVVALIFWRKKQRRNRKVAHHHSPDL